jgi:hypothetical protein
LLIIEKAKGTRERIRQRLAKGDVHMRSMKIKRVIAITALAALMLAGTSAFVAAEESSQKSTTTKQPATTRKPAAELASNEAAQKNAKPASVPTSVPVKAPMSGGRGPQAYQGEPRLFTGVLSTGYKGGASFYAGGTFNTVSTGFPFGVRVGLERTAIDPGDAYQAHEVFIAENPDGEPRKRGESWDIRLDMLYPIKFMKLERSNVFFGGRYNDFEAYFEYVGGAETFDVASTHFGLGGGLETAFAMSQRVDLIFSVGADYYFASTLDGHDTFYRPNNDNDNAIRNYTYQDADEVINQPDVVTRIELAIGYHF